MMVMLISAENTYASTQCVEVTIHFSCFERNNGGVHYACVSLRV